VAEILHVHPGTILFKQGQIGQAFYIILSGRAEVYVNSQTEEGVTILVNTMGPGSAFGERALESASRFCWLKNLKILLNHPSLSFSYINIYVMYNIL
jgi:CRP-like cAMP-binding protein